METTDAGLWRVVQTDLVTGWEDYDGGAVARGEAETLATCRRRAAHGMYLYEVVAAVPADNAVVRDLHERLHRRRCPMEMCNHRDCREAQVRLIDEALARRLAEGPRPRPVRPAVPVPAVTEPSPRASRRRLRPGWAVAGIVRALGGVTLTRLPGARTPALGGR